jgi:hypothetical protein
MVNQTCGPIHTLPITKDSIFTICNRKRFAITSYHTISLQTMRDQQTMYGNEHEENVLIASYGQ